MTISLFAFALGGEVVGMVSETGLVAKIVLLILLFFSLLSWSIIVAKIGLFRRATVQSGNFVRAFRRAKRLQDLSTVAEQFKPSPLVAVFEGAVAELERNGPNVRTLSVQRATQIAASEELTRLENRLTWLATTGSIAPFVGLFGTVWGIIDAFHGLGDAGTATLRAVAPGIAEALITTAAGLFAAVPAVIAYNFFFSRSANSPPAWTTSASNCSTSSTAPAIRDRQEAFGGVYKQQGRTQSSLSDINITPFVDVVLVLLVMFMVTAPILQSGIEVALPKTKTVKEISQQRMVITIDKDQRVFLGDEPININEIPAILRSKVHDPQSQSIFIRADEKVPFGAFATVMDAVKQTGITNVSIVTQPFDTQPNAAGR